MKGRGVWVPAFAGTTLLGWRKNFEGRRHAHRNHRLRQTVPRFPLERAGAVQHCNRLLRSPCRRHRPAGADLCRRQGRRAAHLVRRNAGTVECVCQCLEGRRPCARRPRRGVSVAVAGAADRASGRVPLRPRVGAAVHAVRRGRAGVSSRQFRRQGRGDRRRRLGETLENPRPAALPAGYLRHQRRRPCRRQIVLVVDRNGVRAIRDRRYFRRRSRCYYLHLGNDRKSERRAARPPRAARAPAERRDGA